MSTITKGGHLIEVLNELGVDYGCFGNHEFDFGYESLKRRLAGNDDDDDEDVDYPVTKTCWLAANITETGTGFPMGGAEIAIS